ncbi:MAG TPA: hypothetical protein VN923_00065, partial [Thermoanaerobaculia bacterium]|nr:hypothetical protein [Thermoanaerobaculia bacterium]
HFRTTVQKGLEIIAGLRGHTTGYAVPHFIVDAPGGGGKIPLQPDYLVGRDGDDLVLRNFEGKLFRYRDPLPADAGGSVSDLVAAKGAFKLAKGRRRTSGNGNGNGHGANGDGSSNNDDTPHESN